MEDCKMARAKYQVLVIPYHVEKENIKYCIFKRSDMDAWQFIAGGGENEDETVIISAKREAYEEANIDKDCKYVSLDIQSSIPTYCFKEVRQIWGKDCLVIPEYSFAVMIDNVRRHIVGGTYRTLISVKSSLRLCRTGICRRFSAG